MSRDELFTLAAFVTVGALYVIGFVLFVAWVGAAS